jgi:hypothetical protein
MLTSLSGVEPQDMSASMQVSGSLSHLVGGPDQMTPKAQVTTWDEFHSASGVKFLSDI